MAQTSGNIQGKWVKTVGWMFLVLSFFLWGCVSGQAKKTEQAPPEKAVQQSLTLMSIAVTPDGNTICLTGDQPLTDTYTAMKDSALPGVVLYFTRTRMAREIKDILPDTGPVQSVVSRYIGKKQTTVKVEIFVEQPFSYEVLHKDKQLMVKLHAIPAGDTSRAGEQDAGPVQTDDALVVGKDAQGNAVIFTHGEIPSVAGNQGDTVAPVSSAGGEGEDFQVADAHGESRLENIEFTTTREGKSVITIDTLYPVRYDMQRQDKDQLRLYLFNTRIPSRHQRPLITTYFNSAVEQVLPVGGDGRNPDDAVVVINLRQKVPYRIDRDGTRLTLVFDPADVAAPPFNEARVVLNGAGEKQQQAEETAVSAAVGTAGHHTREEGARASSLPASRNPLSSSLALEPGGAAEEDEGMASGGQDPAKKRSGDAPVYTGEKISLDFFETDIKNVFRILKSVSGENFAVDKDVTGNVTLALENPVPWDQVLDLVLRMNGLGKVREDGILRIATQATLKKEYEQEQAALAAQQKAKAQKEKQEPLITEYISINYSNAGADIKPHLEKLLTPERGQVSVDARTNMIILTDVQEKIDQAKELINRLDMVTPQIMIAARVVEVTKSFSRELGIAWGMSSEDVYRSDLGGTYGFDVAMNYPVASNSSISYTFSRITGTPFAINATLTAAESRGDVRIISSPRILTLDNKKATITQGLEYPYQVVDDNDVSTEFKDIDLKLEVTPHVTPDKRVSMEVAIEKSDITDFAVTGEPVISKNEAKTELLVNDGNTIVIGGVVKRTVTDDSNGFPILSGIPILGHLFRSDSKGDSKNELLIFLTPTIVQLDQKIQ